jgi:hypothetical protein
MLASVRECLRVASIHRQNDPQFDDFMAFLA